MGASSHPYDQNNLATHVGDQLDHVLANRSALAESLRISDEQLFFTNQVHGTTIVEIDHLMKSGSIYECDGLISRVPGVGLAVLVADCAPLLLVGPRTVAAIHVGWRGLFGGIVEKAVALMAGESFAAVIGPTICGNCYEIGDDLAERAQLRGFRVGRSTRATNENEFRSTLDIPRSILSIIDDLAPNQVKEATWNGVCTFESQDHFSFRREQVTGRQAGVVVNGS
jgi:YfiH family protein